MVSNSTSVPSRPTSCFVTRPNGRQLQQVPMLEVVLASLRPLCLLSLRSTNFLMYCDTHSYIFNHVSELSAGRRVKYDKSNCVWLNGPGDILQNISSHCPLSQFPHCFSSVLSPCQCSVITPSPICFDQHKQCVFSLPWLSSVMEDVTVPWHFVSGAYFFLKGSNIWFLDNMDG